MRNGYISVTSKEMLLGGMDAMPKSLDMAQMAHLSQVRGMDVGTLSLLSHRNHI